MSDNGSGPRAESSLRVLIIGGGLSGLLAAHGLLSEGIDVEVFERGAENGANLAGFGIHLHTHGVAAMRACLPEENWKAFDAVAGHAGGGDIRFYDEQLTLLAEHNDDAQRRSIGRIELHDILIKGLGPDGHDVVRFDRRFTGYETLPDGRVRTHFADGSQAEGDVLVGADGSNSVVRQQYLPDLERVDIARVVLAGLAELTDELTAELPAFLIDGTPNSIVPRRDDWLFVCAWRFRDGVQGAARSYVLWSYTAAESSFPDDILAWPAAKLIELVRSRTASWSPQLQRVVEASDTNMIGAIPLKTMPPLKPWAPSAVTLMGDAAHTMSPLAGIGANTALHDAGVLRAELAQVVAGRKELVAAIGDYDAQMRATGNKAIEVSLRNANTAGSQARLPRFTFRTVLRLAQASPPVKNRLLRLAKSARQRI